MVDLVKITPPMFVAFISKYVTGQNTFFLLFWHYLYLNFHIYEFLGGQINLKATKTEKSDILTFLAFFTAYNSFKVN